MAEGNAISQQESEESLELSFKDELAELDDLHTQHGDSLNVAFTPHISDYLRQLSEELCRQTLISEPSGVSSRTADITGTTPGEMTPISSPGDTPDHQETKKNVYKFICDEFMTAANDQRMKKFRQFLGQVKEKASSIRLPDGSSLMTDEAMQHCRTAMTTMKDVISSKFGSITNLIKDKVPTEFSPGAGSSLFSGVRQTREASNLGPPGDGTQQNISARTPGVIVQNPMHDRLPKTGQQTYNVAIPIQGNPTHPTSQGFSKIDHEEGTPRKRHRLEKQPHVDEED